MYRNDDDAPVMLGYSASSNISFQGEIDLGYTWGEWRDLATATREEVIDEIVYDLVDVYVLDEED